jgi:hypothetical protein
MHLLRIFAFIIVIAQPTLAGERNATFAVRNMTCALCPVTVKAAMYCAGHGPL